MGEREPEVAWQQWAGHDGHEKGSTVHTQTQVVLTVFCDRQNDALSAKDVHILISGTCEFVTLYDKRDAANVILLRILRWESTWHYSGGSNLITWVLISERATQESQTGERCVNGSRHWRDATTNQGRQASTRWKRQGNGFSPTPSRSNTALP